MHCNSPIAITQHFIRTHMERRNLEDALSCLTDTVSWFGTGAFEVVHGKIAARQFLAEEISAFPAGYKIAFEDMSETMLTADSGTVFGRVLITDHIMGSQIDCRVTTACVQCPSGFLIASLHMSFPSELQKESEYYPLTIASQKIQQLKDSFFNETIPGGLICCDTDHGFKLRYVNDFFVKLLGYQNKTDFLSATDGLFVNCFCEDADAASMMQDVQAMKVDDHCTFTYRVNTKSGHEIWLRYHTHKYVTNDISGLLCFCMDVSDIIQMETELKEQKNQLEFANAEIQTIISNIPGGVHRCPLFNRIHVNYVSHGFEEMSGYTQAEIHTLFNDNYAKMLIKEDRSIFSNAIRRLAIEPASQDLNYRMRRKDGAVIRVTDHFRSVRMEDGKMWGFGVATDVTSRYETLAQLKLLTDSIPGGLAIYEYSPRGLATVYFSDGVCNMIGYTRDEYAEIVKHNMANMVFEEDRGILYPQIAQMVAGGQSLDCVYRQRTKNGSYRWLNLRGTVADRWGDVIRINAVLLDITDAKKSEEKLRLRDEEYSLAIKQSGKVVYRYTLADKSAYMLQKAPDLFGFPVSAKNVPESILALNFIAPESVKDFIAFYERIFKGEKSGCATFRRKLKSGGFGWYHSRFTTLFSSSGEPVSAVISIEDITRQYEQELENEVLRQNEELFQIVVSHSDRFIVKYDLATRTAYVQPLAAAAFGVDEVLCNVPYSCVERGGIAEESVQTYIHFYETLLGGEPAAKAMIKMRRNGQHTQWGWYRFDGSTVFDEKKQPIYAVLSFVEVTKQYEKELAYERMSKHINQLSKDAMLYFEANLTEMKIEHASGHWLSNIKQDFEMEPMALLAANINEMVYLEDHKVIKTFFDRDSLLLSFAEGKTEKEAEVRLLQNGQPKWVCITVEMISDPYTENILVYVLFRDIDKTKTKEMSILKQAETDGLTNLYNRVALEQKIRQVLKMRRDERGAFVIIDMDDLKKINDALGHIQGDRAICAFADTLRTCFEPQDLVGRIGGDEFIVFLRDVKSEKELSETMGALVHQFSALCVGKNEDYHLRGSIGIALSGAGLNDFETLYKRADTALYYVKRHGKDNYAFYSADMDSVEQPVDEYCKNL